MMYRHSVTVYDARRLRLKTTIPDAVRLSRLGYPRVPGHPARRARRGRLLAGRALRVRVQLLDVRRGLRPRGARRVLARLRLRPQLRLPHPASTPCASTAPTGWGRSPRSWRRRRDGRYVLVSNWCGYDLSVISTRRGREIRRVPIGAYPRGIAVSPTKDVAYVAMMGGTRGRARGPRATGPPRGLRGRAPVRGRSRLGPAGRYLFVTLNAEGRVARLDLRTGAVVKVSTGTAPRSLAMAPDGRAALRRQLRERHGEQGARVGHAGAAVGRRPATTRSGSPTSR